MFYLLILGSKFNPTANKAKVRELVNAGAPERVQRMDSLYCTDIRKIPAKQGLGKTVCCI